MSGYPGPPPFGGQYSNVPFGGPFPPNFAFNNMMPPSGPPFGHQQQPAFPPTQIPPPGSISYGNNIAYQNNAQFHQQQVPFPPQPPAPFYPPFGSYNNHNPYAIPYSQNPFAEAAAAQQTQNGTARGQPPQAWNTLIQDSNKSAQNQIGDIQISSPGRVVVDSLSNAISKDTTSKQGMMSSNETTPGQTPVQSNLAILSEADLGLKPALNSTRKSSTVSDQSFDPYSGITSQTPGEAADAVTATAPTIPPVSTLPGLEPDIDDSSQSEMEITREQKKTLAIQAIQDLASRKIGFDQISKEDIQLELLKDLYLESGVPLVLPTDKRNEVTKPSEEANKKSLTTTSNKKAASVNADVPTITAVPNFNLPIVSVTSTKSTKPPIQITTNDASAKNITLTKDAMENTPASATTTRQDYLAKLQVAKDAAKNKVTAPNVSLAQERSSYLAKLQAAKEAVKQGGTQKPSQSEVQTVPQQADNTLSVSTETSLPKVESNPVQTRANIDALLRQKLEALRKTQSSTVSSISTPPIPNAVSTPNKAQPSQERFSIPEVGSSNTLEASVVAPTTNGKAQDTEVSFFVPGDVKDFPGLPGLPGLTSDPLPTTTSSNNHQSFKNTAQIIQPIAAPNVSSQIWSQQASSETMQSRKRPVASDFNDLPPPKLPRISAPQSDSLVIEISEDEGEISDSDHPENSKLDAGIAHDQASLNSLISRPDFASRSNSYNASSQILNPDLQAKEDAIRELKQRILAATLRKTTKTTTEIPPATKPAASLSSEIEQAQRLENQDAAIKVGTQELTSQEKALAAAKLQAQKHLEQIRRNQASLNAHANKTQQDVENASSNAEREQKLQRKIDLEAKLSSIEAIINTTEANLVLIKQEQDKLLNRIQEENQARSLLMDELKELLEGLEKETSPKVADVAANNDELTTPSIQLDQNDAPNESLQEEQPVSGKQPDSIQIAMAQPIEVPVPISLSSSNATSSLNSPHRDEVGLDDEMDSADEGGEEQMDIDNDSVVTTEDEYDPENIAIDFHEPPQPGLVPETHEAMDNELPDYVDDYEPSQNVEVLAVKSDMEQDSSEQDPPTSYQSVVPAEESSAAVSISPPSSPSEQEHIEDMDSFAQPNPPEHLEDKLPENSIQTASETLPSPMVSNIDTPIDHSQEVSTQAENTDALISDINDKVPDEPEHEMIVDDSSLSNQHFVPYESPLAQFISYRFHPQFSENVSGGFRSLTYNHKINPNLEFCKWELAGGICNDLNCDSQHFKDIVLTDNNLLLQLGSVHEGTTQAEREAYVSGLKNTIYSMRAKGLKDIGSIAAEIVAYRQKFLNDPSRVIANLNIS